jgi:hypothetical protein
MTLEKIPHRIRRHALLIITALVVAFVRTFLQYHHYFWDSIGQFLISWFIHYVAVGLLVVISGTTIMTCEKYFLDDEKQNHGINIENVIVYVSIVLLVASLLVFFMAHVTPDGMGD